jgi:hypothetical protein
MQHCTWGGNTFYKRLEREVKDGVNAKRPRLAWHPLFSRFIICPGCTFAPGSLTTKPVSSQSEIN